jgi:methionyl-tRNA synthetase
LYCEGCEVFYTEKETVELNGAPSCPTHKQTLKVLSEENYFFKLSSYEEKIKTLLKREDAFLSPEFRNNEVLSFVEQGLKDFSVSRTSFKWGISLPFDPGHIIYVWYDALINYLSAVKYPIKDESGKCLQGDESFFNQFWPCDVHVIGKDITRFHTVYWPAMLMSAGIDLPDSVWAHGFINLNGEKMSKTRGNIVTPDEVMADFGTTALRWYLIAANPFDGDGNYSDQDLILKCNADLSNNIGNLVNRTLSMAAKYFPEKTLKPNAAIPTGVENLKSRFEKVLGTHALRLKEALEKENNLMKYASLCIEFSMALNKMIDETKPWSLAKVQQLDVLETVLYELLEGIRILGVALWPIIPDASEAILKQLGFAPEDQVLGVYWSKVQTEAKKTLTVPLWQSLESFAVETSAKVRPPQPLFVRLEQKLEKSL